MQKERREMLVSSRVSPYPLRSCRNKKQKEAKSPIEIESVSEWEDIRCVICLEPPHNAVLLQCSSFSKGCRAYMCDTSGRHSNCFKQYRRNNTTGCNDKTLRCPYCRGEVYGTTKSTCARRFMNARPRCCSVDKCGFSGTYSQLKTHLKAAHPDITPPKIDPWEQHMWEQLERETEYMAMLNARQRWESEQRLLSSSLHQIHFRHPMIGLNFDSFMHSLFLGPSMESRTRNQVTADPAHMPRLEFHATMYPRWAP